MYSSCNVGRKRLSSPTTFYSMFLRTTYIMVNTSHLIYSSLENLRMILLHELKSSIEAIQIFTLLLFTYLKHDFRPIKQLVWKIEKNGCNFIRKVIKLYNNILFCNQQGLTILTIYQYLNQYIRK